MLRKIRQTEADIVHIHLPNPSAVLAYLASGHTGRLIIGYHSDTLRQRALSTAFRPFLRSVLNRSEAIIATSLNYINSSATLRPYRERCRVVPFGIAASQYESCDRSSIDRIRALYGSRIIVSVGRLVYYKGLEYLVDAMTKVRGTLLIGGSGPLGPVLMRRVRNLGLQDKVIFLGDVLDLVPYYHAADLFVLPSVARTEAFGIVQLEAMSCGKPVVNTALDSGVPFVSVHGSTGLTVPPADSNALANAITLLLEDEQLRAEYGRAARLRARRQFDLPSMIQGTLQVYEDVVGQNPNNQPWISHKRGYGC